MQAVATAVAVPIRRRVLELVRDREVAAGELASQFDVSRPAVSRHLRVLREHGLVHARVEGQRRLYSLDPRPLEELDAWLDHYGEFWRNRLAALDTELKRRGRKR